MSVRDDAEMRDPYAAIIGDGLPARVNGGWAESKLYFLETYARVALDATKAKKSRYYVDLFAGPGAYREKGTARFRFGSPIRSLLLQGQKSGAAFTHFVFVNKDPGDHEVLERRVGNARAADQRVAPADRVWAINGDANHAVDWVLQDLHPRGYALFYADIENPSQWPWTTVQALRSRAHESIDVLVLFPLHMALNRMVPKQGPIPRECATALTRFFGTDAWEPLTRARRHAEERKAMRRAFTELYRQQLGTLWKYPMHVLDVKRQRMGQDLYQLLFASDHPAGRNIADWARRNPASGQSDLFGS